MASSLFLVAVAVAVFDDSGHPAQVQATEEALVLSLVFAVPLETARGGILKPPSHVLTFEFFPSLKTIDASIEASSLSSQFEGSPSVPLDRQSLTTTCVCWTVTAQSWPVLLLLLLSDRSKVPVGTIVAFVVLLLVLLIFVWSVANGRSCSLLNILNK